MLRGEYEQLLPWLSDGVGVARGEEPPDERLVRKGYLEAVEGGYALTEKAATIANRLIRSTQSSSFVPVELPEGYEP